MKNHQVTVTIWVDAESPESAREEVGALLEYAFEVANDEGNLTSFSVHADQAS